MGLLMRAGQRSPGAEARPERSVMGMRLHILGGADQLEWERWEKVGSEEQGGSVESVGKRHRPCWRSLTRALGSLSHKVASPGSCVVLLEARPT